ncbi:hypothetical protein AvCA_27140 [Azotobacter vinelandii CA]|uniref:Uncharacterized protein n=2 Tax=Azotobacter vinelandii TaxID=354 RepID=C1DJW9_AZOVD|nr:hypothetical protein Avin_27140 [Azotobacter vinelandii DJ]AGK14865.1 hypothetical protein AvCA_27140 [Azotobacter vinelandii CA]AGK20834.1 hypothetical protein AvCA6_27140 [Azotobacter vinelandii CA6]
MLTGPSRAGASLRALILVVDSLSLSRRTAVTHEFH